MNLRNCVLSILLLASFLLQGCQSNSATQTQASTNQATTQGTSKTNIPLNFAGRYLLALSDADMVPSTYVDGQLGVKQLGIEDTLTILPLPLDLKNRSPQPMQVGQINVSNAVTAWPLSLEVSPDGRSGFVVETSEPAPKGATKFDQLPVGTKLRSLDLANPMNPRIVDTIELGRRPEAVDINPEGDLLAVTTSREPGKQVHLIPVKGTKLGQPQSFPIEGLKAEGEIGGIRWHPSGRFFAINLQTRDEVRFYQVIREDNSKFQIRQWGEPVKVGKFPVAGYFTPNGQFFVTNSVHWGENVDGFFVGAPPGSLTSIRFVNEGNNPKHQVISTIKAGISPEGLAMSRDGRLIATPNMIRSYLPWDDSRMTSYSSISLVRMNPDTGQLSSPEEYRLDGNVLPQGIVFDAEGKNLAVTSFINFDLTERRGGIHFFRVVDGDGDKPRLETTGFKASVVRGPHQLFLIP
ncbi:hypothetical protein BC008_04615 [Mastigocoleus testarum BC008]|uniref:Lactonase n=2 Tax=Mastigocoleus TaxID=996924 RepID=A0A0V7ZYD9_9CYAN|nr:hypothetical protein BC008_04615 [Mastigocoleus testarum BC008]